MRMDKPPKAYGEGRVRANVSYGDVERAAIAILKQERRPTVETVREALGSGSPDTIGNALKRFWRDLGARIEGDPAALTRMPPDIADLADGMWQRALKLAGEAAKNDDNAARERLRRIEIENDIRAHSLDLREKEWDAAARARERALADARDHLVLVMKSLGREQATSEARDARIADLEGQIDQYRQQIASLIAAAIAKNHGRPVRRKAGAGSVPPAHRPSRAPQKKPLPKPARAKQRTAKRASILLQKRRATRHQPSGRKRRR
jgi:hypothetical protein